MNDLQIVNLEQTDITAWDFARIKEELAQTLSQYQSIVYTDDTIKSAKNDKATLAKAKKLVEDQRKAYKAKCLAPYEAFEPQIKELVSMIEEQRVLIDDVVKEYTERQKQEKEVEVKKYYDKKAFVLGSLAEPLYAKILDAKWLNASTSRTKYEEEVQVAVNNALNDINVIKNMNSPYVDTLLEKYTETLSLDDVKAKMEELETAASKAGLTQSASVVTSDVQEVKQEIKANETEGVSVKIYANASQMRQICDFMKVIGVNYEM